MIKKLIEAKKGKSRKLIKKIMKKVSVIVPVYNVEKYIAKCLDSLVNQTLEDIEIIVINDSSPDNSEKIILEYKEKYKEKIIYLKKENGGLSDTRNYGLMFATGEFVGFVDSDDYVSLNMFQDMYEYAKVNHLDIVVCDTELVYPNNQKDKKKVVPASYNIANLERNYLIAPPMACNKLYKKELFQDDFLFKKDIWYEDLELIPTLILKTKKIGFLNEPYYKYLQRGGSIMNQEAYNEKILDILDVLNSIKNRFRKYKGLKTYQEEIEYLYIEHLLYSTPLRISPFIEGKKYLSDTKKMMSQKFPNWKKNKYLKKKSYKFKLICYLSFYKQKWLILLLSKRR